MPVDFLRPEEVRALIKGIAHERDRLLARFLYESGCTVSEASDLKPNQVHRDGSVHLADRSLRISGELAQELLREASTWVFSSRQSESITPKRIQQILKPYLAALHKGKVTPLILRYSHVVHAYQRGLDFSAIAAQTGLGAQRIAQIIADIPAQSDYRAFFERGGSA